MKIDENEKQKINKEWQENKIINKRKMIKVNRILKFK